MTADLLLFPDADGVAIEADPIPTDGVVVPLLVEPDLLPSVGAVSGVAPGEALTSLPLVEILPPGFRLPTLVQFVPNVALKAVADEATTYALSIAVEGAGGLHRADLAVTALRTSLGAITEHFREPAELSHELHKRITGVRAGWLEAGTVAVKTVGARIYAEQARLEAVAVAERRLAQAEADRQAREAAKREAEAAAQAHAPAIVVEELKRQAETATAPPVTSGASAPPPLRGSSTVTTWKARLKGTPGDAEPNPDVKDLSVAQRVEFFALLKAVLLGEAPLGAVEINWAYLNARAVSDKATLSIPGIETFTAGGVRAKSARSRT